MVELPANVWGESHGKPPTAEDSEEAVLRYTRVLLKNPRDNVAYSRRGHAYYWLKLYDEAIADFMRAVELDPACEGARGSLASAYGAAGQYAEALREYDEIARRWPEANYFQNRGLLYEKMGRDEAALADHLQATRVEPQRAGGWWNLAALLERLGRLEEAEQAWWACYACDHTQVQARERALRLAE
jgi:tetratricopeptide (TPR) repeat protein